MSQRSDYSYDTQHHRNPRTAREAHTAATLPPPPGRDSLSPTLSLSPHDTQRGWYRQQQSPHAPAHSPTTSAFVPSQRPHWSPPPPQPGASASYRAQSYASAGHDATAYSRPSNGTSHREHYDVDALLNNHTDNRHSKHGQMSDVSTLIKNVVREMSLGSPGVAEPGSSQRHAMQRARSAFAFFAFLLRAWPATPRRRRGDASTSLVLLAPSLPGAAKLHRLR